MYEIVSDMSGRQDAVEERLSSLEDKMQLLQVGNWAGFICVLKLSESDGKFENQKRYRFYRENIH